MKYNNFWFYFYFHLLFVKRFDIFNIAQSDHTPGYCEVPHPSQIHITWTHDKTIHGFQQQKHDNDPVQAMMIVEPTQNVMKMKMKMGNILHKLHDVWLLNLLCLCICMAIACMYAIVSIKRLTIPGGRA